MNTTKKIFGILSLLFGIVVGASAQSKVSSNSLNSPRNYKMPQNAKVAKENGLDAPVSVEYKSESGKKGTIAKGNYKATLGEKEDNGAVINVLPIEIEVNAVASQRNYKTASPNKKGKVPSKTPKQNEKEDKDAVVRNE